MLVGGDFHLTYCSNIHPGERWADVSAVLADSLPGIRRTLGLDGPMGIGLRLSDAAARVLEEPRAMAAFKEFLAHGHYYVFTINAFPFGAFHGSRVKENVYLPDWRDPARIEYSDRVARVLAALLEGRTDIEGSVSTVPGAFRAGSRTPADADAIAAGILRHVASLRELRERTGVTIKLALEPEPACFLETVDDAVGFFRSRLFDAPTIRRLSPSASPPLSVDDVRLHAGVCLDACHMAVEFEDPAEAFARLAAEGIGIPKVQISSALRVPTPSVSAGALAALGQFADDVYLHQVVARCGRTLERHTDLPEALLSESTRCEEWRVHFHVPLFMETLAPLETTQHYATEVLSLLQENRACRYLEVETYTWDVLPAEFRAEDKCVAIARELAWVRSRLET